MIVTQRGWKETNTEEIRASLSAVSYCETGSQHGKNHCCSRNFFLSSDCQSKTDVL